MSIIPNERIERSIFLIRGHRVMFDSDLAALYGVATGNLNKAVKRNMERFPDDFMFQLNKKETDSLRFQIGRGSPERKGGNLFQIGRGSQRHRDPRFRPYVFTQEGVAMLSGVLNSRRAIEVNIAIMRVFVRFKEMISSNKELAVKLAELERKIEGHGKDIHTLFAAIRQLMVPPERPRRRIGFGET